MNRELSIGLFLMAILWFSCKNDTVNISERNASIKQVLNKQLKEWNSGNIEGFMEGYKEGSGTTFITNKKLLFNRDALERMYENSYDTPQKMGHLSLDIDTILNFVYTPNMALVVGKWRVQKTNDSSDNSGRFSLIFEKNIDWKICVDQTW